MGATKLVSKMILRQPRVDVRYGMPDAELT